MSRMVFILLLGAPAVVWGGRCACGAEPKIDSPTEDDKRARQPEEETTVVATVGQRDGATGPVPEGQEDPATGTGGPDSPGEAPVSAAPHWYDDYGEATEAARRQEKLLLLYFHPSQSTAASPGFERSVLSDREIAKRLQPLVRLRLPFDAKVQAVGGEIQLLRHGAFREMLGQPGLAVIDYAHQDEPYYGRVVSTFPFSGGRTYSAREVSVILGLPQGTLTQRTLIYAVRTHPDRPASTDGQIDPYLCEQAASHSRYQARICLQGHHRWESRFHRINRRLPRRLMACEVCAESWPGENLLEAAIECVRCWRFSSGHWSAVRQRHQVYGYDMKRGSNGIWYATGIFGTE